MVFEFSHKGTYHEKNGMENQDVIQSLVSKRFDAISLADGVSSCTMAKEGATISCDSMNHILINAGCHFFNFSKEDRAEMILSHILFELNKQATVPVSEYSSTLSSVLIDKELKKIMYFNLGDCIVIGFKKEGYEIICKPFDSRFGCVVTTSKDAKDYVDTDTIEYGDFETILIASDGAWKSLFDQTKFNKDLLEAIQNKNFEYINQFIENKKCSDDSSCVFYELVN